MTIPGKGDFVMLQTNATGKLVAERVLVTNAKGDLINFACTSDGKLVPISITTPSKSDLVFPNAALDKCVYNKYKNIELHNLRTDNSQTIGLGYIFGGVPLHFWTLDKKFGETGKRNKGFKIKIELFKEPTAVNYYLGSILNESPDIFSTSKNYDNVTIVGGTGVDISFDYADTFTSNITLNLDDVDMSEDEYYGYKLYNYDFGQCYHKATGADIGVEGYVKYTIYDSNDNIVKLSANNNHMYLISRSTCPASWGWVGYEGGLIAYNELLGTPIISAIPFHSGLGSMYKFYNYYTQSTSTVARTWVGAGSDETDEVAAFAAAMSDLSANPVQNVVNVTGSGNADINGAYVYRGSSGGRVYFSDGSIAVPPIEAYLSITSDNPDKWALHRTQLNPTEANAEFLSPTRYPRGTFVGQNSFSGAYAYATYDTGTFINRFFTMLHFEEDPPTPAHWLCNNNCLTYYTAGTAPLSVPYQGTLNISLGGYIESLVGTTRSLADIGLTLRVAWKVTTSSFQYEFDFSDIETWNYTTIDSDVLNAQWEVVSNVVVKKSTYVATKIDTGESEFTGGWVGIAIYPDDGSSFSLSTSGVYSGYIPSTTKPALSWE